LIISDLMIQDNKYTSFDTDWVKVLRIKYTLKFYFLLSNLLIWRSNKMSYIRIMILLERGESTTNIEHFMFYDPME
jgi:hypothetical protein